MNHVNWDVSPFFKLLSVASWLNSIRNIIPEADRVISLLDNASAKHLSGSSKINPLLPYQLLILYSSLSSIGIIYQQGNGITEIYSCHNSSHQPVAFCLQKIIDLIMTERIPLKQLADKESTEIIVTLFGLY